MSETILRTRFAPSPTGRMHVGNGRTALFNYLFARRHGGRFLLRPEDTDTVRSTPAHEADLCADLRWLGLDWDDGPGCQAPAGGARQSERTALYRRHLERLRTGDNIYPCFCSEAELARVRERQRAAGQPPRYPGTCAGLDIAASWRRVARGESAALRFRVPPTGETGIDDLVRGAISFRHPDLGDFVVARSDGSVGFLFANALDDALMGVTHVLRGEDHLANTPRQKLLLAALDLPAPRYGHFAMIMGSDGAPLSKRNGSRSLADLRAAGFLPGAVNNYLARLGHTLDAERLLDLPALAAGFSVARLGRSPARFDADHLAHWQARAVAEAGDAELLAWDTAGRVPADRARAFLRLVRPNTRYPADLREWAVRLFDAPDADAEAAATLEGAGARVCAAALRLREAGVHDFAEFTMALRETTGCKGRALFMPLRAALTGTTHGPELAGVMALLGEAEVQSRLRRAALVSAPYPL